MRPCPRCEHDGVSTIGKSPVEGCWELYMCSRCEYVWRSTESEDLLAQTVKVGEKELGALLDCHTFKTRSL
ncbi:MAG: non-oxidative hydroxyarylic acid decarboxylases subunit D [Dehalococcoidia bacterium]|nr:non-oxidative hydroxyarylic acid decarboxylases subunit D [Dehalococcoidia bacterium]